MKSLVRWSATLGLIGGVAIGSLLATGARVLALTNEQVAERLRSVPVFAITDEAGAPLVAAPSEGEEGATVTGVFISRQDAQNFLNSLRENNPDLAGDVQVVPVSLAEVYQLALAGREQEDRLQFTFVPMRQQVQSALTILQEEEETVSEFEGVPLFIAKSTAEGGGYLTIQQGEEQVIPIYFNQEDLQAMLDRLQEVQPGLASEMDIQVVNLEGLIDTLESSDNPELTQIMLVPPRESVEFIRSLRNQSEQGQPQPAPGN